MDALSIKMMSLIFFFHLHFSSDFFLGGPTLSVDIIKIKEKPPNSKWMCGSSQCYSPVYLLRKSAGKILSLPTDKYLYEVR